MGSIGPTNSQSSWTPPDDPNRPFQNVPTDKLIARRDDLINELAGIQAQMDKETDPDKLKNLQLQQEGETRGLDAIQQELLRRGV